MKILLVGNGGREHALAWRLRRSPSVTDILCPNANPGIAQLARAPKLDLPTVGHWAELAQKEAVDLVMVGPEVPLEEGLADACHSKGIPVFGPPKAGARIESSKAWCKEVMVAAGVPTARAEWFRDEMKAKEFANSLGLPVVIKADGLAAGKGVTVAMHRAEADRAIEENLRDHRFGASSQCILIEEFMDGEEASVFGLCDGETVISLVAAQDHKRVFDGDAGPNTGGMGAYAPAPIVTAELAAYTQKHVLEPTLRELANRGISYRGVLYAGLMIGRDGRVRVVEFNCRFGDPETQVVLPLLQGDLGELLLACAEGRLARHAAQHPEVLKPRPGASMTVVLASGGYPGDFRKGLPISGLAAFDGLENGAVFHAGTIEDEQGGVRTAGGRVLACTAWDNSLAECRDIAYRMAESINFEGKHYRRDIAHRALHFRS